MFLPTSPSLPIHALAGSFNNTSATYKFYWFLSILQELENGNSKPLKVTLFSRMVANAWYTVNYFHVSFGKQDMLQRAITNLRSIEGISIEEKPEAIIKKLAFSTDPRTVRELRYFNQEVPWRFLSPWIKGSQKDVYKRSESFENSCPYSLFEDHIEINPEWIPYFIQNAGVLKSFCYWHLTMYLQKHNPNVPDLANKLVKPPYRNGLGKQRRFWNLVIDELGPIDCIYTQKKLTPGAFAVEHFIPHAFVSHDLIWNLIPACSSFNSAKSDKLPPLERYFDSFFEIQVKGLEVVLHKEPKNKLLEDYLNIFPELTSAVQDKDHSKQRFREQIEPLVSIAANNGFEFLTN